ncbi:ABC transporter ATP-binding protein [Nitrospira lenta]|uniref:Lipid A export ATP-binding/permease protein MsbA n=1 Tax=Nitrospira lenta TaxID=1436998 RepID=A0A330L8M6_9BACT|nr:ABC transporter ATP-binding protein [Nitrospira lenta]SPP65443.1 Lipid A export ATP-binding/permease protein MsbA [Nitrospira lenta]
MKTLLRVLQYLRPYRLMVLGTFLFAGLTTAFELVPPWLIKILIDDVIQANRIDLLTWVFVGLLGSYLLRNLCSAMRIRLNNSLEQQVVHDLHVQVFAALQRLSISFFENRPTGEIMSRVLNDTEHMQRIFVDGLEEIITAGLTLIGIMVVLFWLNWKLALLALLPIPILIIGAALFTKRVHGYYREIRKGAAELNALLQDSLAGIRETMGFNRQPYEQDRFGRKSDQCRKDTLKAMYLWSFYSPGMMLVGSLGGALVLWFGTAEVLAKHLSVGELVMFMSYLALFYVPINQIHSVNHMLQHALAASERVFDVLDTVPEVRDEPGIQAPVARFTGAVVFDHVQFHYRSDAPILKDVNITVRAGERVALVGPSGAGKSTTLKLLNRFYDVTGGSITIDGMDIRRVPLAFLRNQIGLVQQEPFLFNGTVRENILYGDLSAGQDAIEAAAKAARAHEFIVKLPEGYETWIGERGVKLSVGQRQRVSIARVLLKDPPIVMFDEATSNIDTETEVKIREALNELTKGRTTLIIAHRLSTINEVDRIIVVEHGRVVEEGMHEVLITRGGVYARLYEAQFQV